MAKSISRKLSYQKVMKDAVISLCKSPILPGVDCHFAVCVSSLHAIMRRVLCVAPFSQKCKPKYFTFVGAGLALPTSIPLCLFYLCKVPLLKCFSSAAAHMSSLLEVVFEILRFFF